MALASKYCSIVLFDVRSCRRDMICCQQEKAVQSSDDDAGTRTTVETEKVDEGSVSISALLSRKTIEIAS